MSVVKRDKIKTVWPFQVLSNREMQKWGNEGEQKNKNINQIKQMDAHMIEIDKIINKFLGFGKIWKEN